MGGSVGQSSGTTTQQQASQMVPPPWASAYLQQALQTASSLQQMPFEIAPQPVAPLQPQQAQAFQTVENLQGAYTPYVDAALTGTGVGAGIIGQGFPFLQQGAGLIGQGAPWQTPFGASQYFGAESAGVLPELENVFGQQMAQNTGQGVQQAGGTDAERIAVANSELANQQGLSAGQTLSQLMGQSVSQGQQAGLNLGTLGSQMGNLGGLFGTLGGQLGQLGLNAANEAQIGQNMGLGQAQAALNAGTLQQQQLQNQQNALWQNTNQAISWPFQANSYLGALAEGIAPAAGGSMTGQQAGTSQMKSSSLGGSMKGLGGAFGGERGGRFPNLEDYEPPGEAPRYARGGGAPVIGGYQKGGSTPSDQADIQSSEAQNKAQLQGYPEPLAGPAGYFDTSWTYDPQHPGNLPPPADPLKYGATTAMNYLYPTNPAYATGAGPPRLAYRNTDFGPPVSQNWATPELETSSQLDIPTLNSATFPNPVIPSSWQTGMQLEQQLYPGEPSNTSPDTGWGGNQQLQEFPSEYSQVLGNLFQERALLDAALFYGSGPQSSVPYSGPFAPQGFPGPGVPGAGQLPPSQQGASPTRAAGGRVAMQTGGVGGIGGRMASQSAPTFGAYNFPPSYFSNLMSGKGGYGGYGGFPGTTASQNPLNNQTYWPTGGMGSPGGTSMGMGQTMSPWGGGGMGKGGGGMPLDMTGGSAASGSSPAAATPHILSGPFKAMRGGRTPMQGGGGFNPMTQGENIAGTYLPPNSYYGTITPYTGSTTGMTGAGGNPIPTPENSGAGYFMSSNFPNELLYKTTGGNYGVAALEHPWSNPSTPAIPPPPSSINQAGTTSATNNAMALAMAGPNFAGSLGAPSGGYQGASGAGTTPQARGGRAPMQGGGPSIGNTGSLMSGPVNPDPTQSQTLPLMGMPGNPGEPGPSPARAPSPFSKLAAFNKPMDQKLPPPPPPPKGGGGGKGKGKGAPQGASGAPGASGASGPDQGASGDGASGDTSSTDPGSQIAQTGQTGAMGANMPSDPGAGIGRGPGGMPGDLGMMAGMQESGMGGGDPLGGSDMGGMGGDQQMADMQMADAGGDGGGDFGGVGGLDAARGGSIDRAMSLARGYQDGGGDDTVMVNPPAGPGGQVQEDFDQFALHASPMPFPGAGGLPMNMGATPPSERASAAGSLGAGATPGPTGQPYPSWFMPQMMAGAYAGEYNTPGDKQPISSGAPPTPPRPPQGGAAGPTGPGNLSLGSASLGQPGNPSPPMPPPLAPSAGTGATQAQPAPSSPLPSWLVSPQNVAPQLEPAWRALQGSQTTFTGDGGRGGNVSRETSLEDQIKQTNQTIANIFKLGSPGFGGGSPTENPRNAFVPERTGRPQTIFDPQGHPGWVSAAPTRNRSFDVQAGLTPFEGGPRDPRRAQPAGEPIASFNDRFGSFETPNQQLARTMRQDRWPEAAGPMGPTGPLGRGAAATPAAPAAATSSAAPTSPFNTPLPMPRPYRGNMGSLTRAEGHDPNEHLTPREQAMTPRQWLISQEGLTKTQQMRDHPDITRMITGATPDQIIGRLQTERGKQDAIDAASTYARQYNAGVLPSPREPWDAATTAARIPPGQRGGLGPELPGYGANRNVLPLTPAQRSFTNPQPIYQAPPPQRSMAPVPINPRAQVQQPINRSRFADELNNNPALVARLATIVNGEVGRDAPINAKIVQAETAFNRAEMRGHSLEQALWGTAQHGSAGYYPPTTFNALHQQDLEAFKRDILAPVLRGSNLSDNGHGPMTGNASAGVAARQMRRMYGYQYPGGDQYFREGPFPHDFPIVGQAAGGAIRGYQDGSDVPPPSDDDQQPYQVAQADSDAPAPAAAKPDIPDIGNLLKPKPTLTPAKPVTTTTIPVKPDQQYKQVPSGTFTKTDEPPPPPPGTTGPASAPKKAPAPRGANPVINPETGQPYAPGDPRSGAVTQARAPGTGGPFEWFRRLFGDVITGDPLFYEKQQAANRALREGEWAEYERNYNMFSNPNYYGGNAAAAAGQMITGQDGVRNVSKDIQSSPPGGAPAGQKTGIAAAGEEALAGPATAVTQEAAAHQLPQVTVSGQRQAPAPASPPEQAAINNAMGQILRDTASPFAATQQRGLNNMNALLNGMSGREHTAAQTASIIQAMHQEGLKPAPGGFFNWNTDNARRTGMPDYVPYREFFKQLGIGAAGAGAAAAAPSPAAAAAPSIGAAAAPAAATPAPTMFDPRTAAQSPYLYTPAVQSAYRTPMSEKPIPAGPNPEHPKMPGVQPTGAPTDPYTVPEHFVAEARPRTAMPTEWEAMDPTNERWRSVNFKGEDLTKGDDQVVQKEAVAAMGLGDVETKYTMMERAIADLKPGTYGPHAQELKNARDAGNQFVHAAEAALGLPQSTPFGETTSLDQIKNLTAQLQLRVASQFGRGGGYVLRSMHDIAPGIEMPDTQAMLRVVYAGRAENARGQLHSQYMTAWHDRGLPVSKFEGWFNQAFPPTMFANYAEIGAARNNEGNPITNGTVRELRADPARMAPLVARNWHISPEAVQSLIGGQ